jgi:hypothetical protein
MGNEDEKDLGVDDGPDVDVSASDLGIRNLLVPAVAGVSKPEYELVR